MNSAQEEDHCKYLGDVQVKKEGLYNEREEPCEEDRQVFQVGQGYGQHFPGTEDENTVRREAEGALSLLHPHQRRPHGTLDGL